MCTKHGRKINGDTILREIQQHDESRWSAYVANRDHPATPPGCLEIWLSRFYIVQLYDHPSSTLGRLSIRRIDEREIRESWTEIQRIKDEICGPDCHCVEHYPEASNLVDVANMRNLFILPHGSDRNDLGVWRRQDFNRATDPKGMPLMAEPLEAMGRTGVKVKP